MVMGRGKGERSIDSILFFSTVLNICISGRWINGSYRNFHSEITPNDLSLITAVLET
jgi:hypothetical protein